MTDHDPKLLEAMTRMLRHSDTPVPEDWSMDVDLEREVHVTFDTGVYDVSIYNTGVLVGSVTGGSAEEALSLLAYYEDIDVVPEMIARIKETG